MIKLNIKDYEDLVAVADILAKNEYCIKLNSNFETDGYILTVLPKKKEASEK